MRVMIVGAGQSGIILAQGLARAGVEVELFTDHYPEELRQRGPEPTQLTFASTVAREASVGLDHWSQAAPRWATAGVWAHAPGEVIATGFSGRLPAGGGIAVDPRMKLSRWLEDVVENDGEAEGGVQVHLHSVTLDELEWFCNSGRFQLIVVAVGDGSDLSGLFKPEERPGRRRALAQVLLSDLAEGSSDLEVHTSPSGEVLRIPVLTLDGPADALVMIGDAGGPMDLHPPGGRTRTVDVLNQLTERLHTHMPEVGARVAKSELVEAPLLSYVQPVPRSPVGVLPSGGLMLGLGDTVRPLCPTTGQGWAGSTHAALLYRDHILAHAQEDRPFDAAFMRTVCAAHDKNFVTPAGAFVRMVSDFWSGKLTAADEQRFHAAMTDPQAAESWLASWDDPRRFAEPE